MYFFFRSSSELFPIVFCLVMSLFCLDGLKNTGAQVATLADLRVLSCDGTSVREVFILKIVIYPFTPKSDQCQVPGLQPHQKYNTTQYEELGFS